MKQELQTGIRRAPKRQAPGQRRIVSLLPAATEMVYALGLDGQLAGVTHECDYPAAARNKPVLVRPAVALEGRSPGEIDRSVSQRLRSGASLYEMDEKLFADLAPDLVLTQNLCQVCAPSGNELARLLQSIAPEPEILWMSPSSLAGIEQNIRSLGEATDRLEKAESLIASGRARLEQIAAQTRQLARQPRVFFMEWIEPIYCAGHWVGEMIELAGGHDSFGRKGSESVRIEWPDLLAWAPEVLVLAPCGFNAQTALAQASLLSRLPGWTGLPAVRQGRVYAVDANSYFARPGPRVIEGTELLAHLIHPGLFD